MAEDVPGSPAGALGRGRSLLTVLSREVQRDKAVTSPGRKSFSEDPLPQPQHSDIPEQSHPSEASHAQQNRRQLLSDARAPWAPPPRGCSRRRTEDGEERKTAKLNQWVHCAPGPVHPDTSPAHRDPGPAHWDPAPPTSPWPRPQCPSPAHHALAPPTVALGPSPFPFAPGGGGWRSPLGHWFCSSSSQGPWLSPRHP